MYDGYFLFWLSILKCGHWQRAKIPRLRNQELWFLCSDLLHDAIYSPVKYDVSNSFYF